MKIKLINALLILIPILTFGQTNNTDTLPKRNTFCIEFLGQGLNYSFNYDRLYRLNKKVKTSLSVGFVLNPPYQGYFDGANFGVPLSYNFLFGKKNHHLELGAGVTLLCVSDVYESKLFNNASIYSYLSPKIGYRFQKPQGGLFLRGTIYGHIALVNYEGSNSLRAGHYEYFENIAGATYTNASGKNLYVLPWPGISVGYTFKK